MPHPIVASSDTVTSVTAPSLADDGLSLTRRMPRKGDPTAITNWIEGTVASLVLPPAIPPAAAASESEAYTGSFFDDGADLRHPSSFQPVPGFGTVDHTFYSRGKPKKKRYEEEWTVEKEKALAGDMFRSLAKLKSVARVEVRDARDDGRKKERRRLDKSKVGAVEDDGRVRIMKPLRWGTFIIEGEDGRVVIVDEHGEYDSGKVDEREKLAGRDAECEKRVKRRKEREQEKARKEADKKAKEEARRLRKMEEEKEMERVRAKARDDQRMDKHRRRRGRDPSPGPRSPINEDGLFKEEVSGVASPTKFFMTGARSGWTPSVVSKAKPPEAYTSPPKLVSAPASVRQPSPSKSAPSIRPLIAATAHSTLTSVTKSDGTQDGEHLVTLEASAVRLPSSTSSIKYSDATVSTVLSVTSRDPWMRTSTLSSAGQLLKSKRQGLFGAHSNVSTLKSRRNDGEKHSPRRQSTRISSLSQSSTNHLTAWGEDTDTHSNRAPLRRGRSRGRSRSSTRHARTFEPDTFSQTSSRRATSRIRSASGSRRTQIVAFEYQTQHGTSRPSTRASNTSIAAWIQDSYPDSQFSEHSPKKSRQSRKADSNRAPSTIIPKSEDSQASAVTPYSWRRQVEELSDHSTIGSQGSLSRMASPAPPLIPSDDRGSDGESIPGVYVDAGSVKSHSTYRETTVQDASDEEKNSQQWDSTWSAKDFEHDDRSSPKTSEVGSAKWSGKTGWGGDVMPEHSVAGSTKQNDGDEESSVIKWEGKSGFEEDNETWLNAEVGGVKYREAEWRVDPPQGSWRDV